MRLPQRCRENVNKCTLCYVCHFFQYVLGVVTIGMCLFATPLAAKTCTLSASVYMVSNPISSKLNSAGDLVKPLSYYTIRLHGLRTSQPIVISSDGGSNAIVPCDSYSYIIGSPGFSFSQGTLDFAYSESAHIVGFLSVADIESGMTLLKASVRIAWSQEVMARTRTVTFASLDGRGVFRFLIRNRDVMSVQLPNRTYTILVMEDNRVLSATVMYLAPGETRLIINGNNGEVSVADTSARQLDHDGGTNTISDGN